MDERSPSIFSRELDARRGRAPSLVDLGRENVLSTDDALIGGTIRRSHEQQPQKMAFDHLATIVRGADLFRPDLMLRCKGLLAVSLSLSTNFPEDLLKIGLVIYDVLYAWCHLQAEKQQPHSRAIA
jgi:hypothetical protein